MAPSSNFLMWYIADYCIGNVQQWEFDLDYDGYVIQYFPAMEAENPVLAKRFAEQIDRAVQVARRTGLPEDDFRDHIAKAYAQMR